MQEVFIVGEMQCAPDKIAEVETILTRLRAATRAEKGCIFYQFFEAENRPGVFATIEHWQNAEAEAAHWGTEHLREATSRLGPLLIGDMRLSRYNRTGGETGCI
ncbi:putative quinol monooxygenase [Mameliella sediminis]|uniref:putative quinol monooxygenase n=1 Tax=Mameliella sediminis TaxID=2836866 RepID=UPI001C450DAA|nr:putative quinol monooxygenase [Mameliella sediminis]MBV7393297.1 antibiotic biosynthesis monooxygenase [Mameliella sediminis]